MSRTMKPRLALAVTPACVSQATSAAVLGIDERRFRELFGKHPGAVRVGKLVVIELHEALDALRALRSSAVNVEAEPDDEEDDGPSDVDGVLAAIGRRRVG